MRRSKSCCDPYEDDPDNPGEQRYKNEARTAAEGTFKATLMDCFTLGRVPHGMSMLIIIAMTFGGLAVLGIVMKAEVSGITDDPDFMKNIDNMIEDIYKALNESGVKVVRSCAGPRASAIPSPLGSEYGRYACPAGYTVVRVSPLATCQPCACRPELGPDHRIRAVTRRAVTETWHCVCLASRPAV